MSSEQDSIRLLRDTPVDARRLAQVRGRVLERLAARRSGPGRWILAGAAAVMLLAAAVAWTARRVELEAPVVTAKAPQAPEWALAPMPRRAKVDPGLPPRARWRDGDRPVRPRDIEVVAVQAAPETGGADTALLEIPTSNPDVVLYWLVDSGGD
jgi:hypothetical protein